MGKSPNFAVLNYKTNSAYEKECISDVDFDDWFSCLW